MFDFFRSLFKTAKVVHKTAQVIRADNRSDKELSWLPIEEFLPKWAETKTFPAAGIFVRLRPAASTGDIEQAESRLGVRLPEELRSLYLCSNGIDRELRDSDGPARNVLDVQSLSKPGERSPRLSVQLQGEWLANGRDDVDSEGLELFSSGPASLLPGAQESVLAYADIDDMLVLESDGQGSMAVAVVVPHQGFPVGTVVDIENGTATHYDGVRAWLASGMSMAMRFKEMHARYSTQAG